MRYHKINNLCIMGVLEEEKKIGTEKLLKKIMVENFPDQGQDWDIQHHSRSLSSTFKVTKFNWKGSYPFACLLNFLHSFLIS